MKIVIAQTAGFCMGVKRAVDIALEHAGKSPNGVNTLGPLIHNNQTLDMLKARGVTTITSDTPPIPDKPLLIRAHGVPPDLYQTYFDKGHTIIDGTCPKVKTVHRVIEKYKNLGFAVIIAGDEGHAEVVGLQGYAGNAGHLVSSPEDIRALPDIDKVCLVSQTTFDRTTFDAIALAVKQRFTHSQVVIKKTICSATDQRQNETHDLAQHVDAMIVVGGKNSANTQRLAHIAADFCQGSVQHVETETEINWDALANSRTVGVTAGASTPNWMIKRVVDYLMFMDQSKKKGIAHAFNWCTSLFSNMNGFVAVGAAALYATSCILQGLEPTPAGGCILFLYFLSMYLWNSLANIENTRHLGFSRYRFYHAHTTALYIAAAIGIVTACVISFLQNKGMFSLMVFSVICGLVYHIPIIPPFLRPIFRAATPKDIPTSRDLFVALAWGVLITFVPQAIAGVLVLDLSTLFCFSFIFILAYLRSLIFDLRDIEGDRIMGRETLVTIIGERRIRTAIQGIIVVAILGILAFPFIFPSTHISVKNTGNPIAFLMQSLSLMYLYIFMFWNKNNLASRSPFFTPLAEAPLYISALCAGLAKLM